VSDLPGPDPAGSPRPAASSPINGASPNGLASNTSNSSNASPTSNSGLIGLARLTETPHLSWPTPLVRDSYLAGERANSLADGIPLDWLDLAAEDFSAYVRQRRGVHVRWGVPATVYWYVAGPEYLGTLVIRHRLTPELTDVGGHIGYHVVPPWRRQGHATRMLAAGLAECRAMGLDRVLLTCDTSNEPSRRVILANGGVPDRRSGHEDRFWIELSAVQGDDPPGSPAFPRRYLP
jgi:predicted acetyltransferase